MKTSEIRKLNPSGKMTMVSGNNDIVFDNGVVIKSESSREKTKTWNKLRRMGFEQHYNFSTDEFNGISQSKNPFNFKIISRQ